MSHTVKNKIDMRISDKKFLEAAAANLKGVEVKEYDNYKLYDGTRVSGLGVTLPGWRYPLFITENDEVVYDNYGGSWGKIEEMNKLVNHVSAEIQMDYLDKMGIDYEVEVEEETQEILITAEIA